MATVTPIRANIDTGQPEPIGELLAWLEISLACLQDRLVQRFGRRTLGRTVCGRLDELREGIYDVRAQYRDDLEPLSAQATRIEAMLRELGLMEGPRPALTLVKGADDP